MPRRALVVLLVVAAAAVVPQSARGADPGALLAERVTLAADLSAVAGWCEGQRWYAARDRVCELVVRVLPDDEVAQRRLGRRRDAAGAWVPDPKAKRAPDAPTAEAGRAEVERRVDVALDAHLVRVRDAVAQLQASWARAATDGGPDVGRDARERAQLDAILAELALLRMLRPSHPAAHAVLREVLLGALAAARARRGDVEAAEDLVRARLPDDAEARAAVGDVPWKGRWVAADVAAGARRRAALRELAARSREAVAPTEVSLAPEETATGLPWTTAWGTARVRVVGTVDAAETRHATTCAAAMWPVAAEALRFEPPTSPLVRVFVLRNAEEAERLLATYPSDASVLAPQRPHVARLASVYLGWGTFLTKAASRDPRLDSLLHLTADHCVASVFYPGNPRPRAWVSNAIGTYLVWRVAGTRYHMTIGGSYGNVWDGPTTPTEADWLARSLVAFQRAGPGSLRGALAKDYAAFDREDVFLAWGFSTWLIEARAEAAAPFLTALGRGMSSDDAARAALSGSVEDVERRVQRWLAQTIEVERAEK
ncbi:MAG: hypothetical protein IT460_07305 [Planctomycetes bacterium]|nr:hypothetical protein [Planctomycetota bacterium]